MREYDRQKTAVLINDKRISIIEDTESASSGRYGNFCFFTPCFQSVHAQNESRVFFYIT